MSEWIESYLNEIERPGAVALRNLAQASLLTAKPVDLMPSPKTKASQSFNERIDRIGDLITSAENGIQEAGRIVVELCREREDAFECIMARRPELKYGFLAKLYRIGNGQLDARVLTIANPVVANKIGSLPIREQTKVLDHTVPIVIGSNGDKKVVYKRVDEIKQSEAAAIGRSIEEQKEAIDQRETAAQKRESRYVIDGDRVYFLDRKVGWRAHELEEIISKLSKELFSNLQSAVKRNQVAR